jgi:transposase
MATATDPFTDWLAGAQVPPDRLTPEQRGLLRAAFQFRRRCGEDYYSTRLLSHFLLHCDSGLKVAQVARLTHISRPTASRQQGRSSKEAIQQAHHRMDGRPYGKLLPRYAGPIAHFLCTHPHATRADLIDFIGHTFDVRVSRTALHHFLKKYGLDAATPWAATPAAPPPAPEPARASAPLPAPEPVGAAAPAPVAVVTLPPPTAFVPQGQPVPTPAPPLCSHARSTRGPSCCCRRPWTGWPPPRSASRTTTAACSAAC